jgi:hypothetical protein
MLKALWIIICSLVGAAVGAIWIGGFTSIPLSLLGGLVGGIAGALLGKHIPFYEWFD